MNPSLPLAAAAFAACVAVASPTAAAAEPVATVAIVTVPKPWYAPQSLVARRMRDTIPQYAQLPGLAYKMYSFAQADGQFGGIYLWRSREQAQAWFGPAWFERVRRERGVTGTVRLFEAPESVDLQPAALAADDDAHAVATLALAALPAGTSREQAAQAWRAATAARPAGLLRTHLVFSDDGRAGELAVWADGASAAAVLGAEGRRLLRERYGADVAVEAFDIPILTPTRLPAPALAGSRP